MTASDPTSIQYRLNLPQPQTHRAELTLTVAQPDPAGQQFYLPVWIPGSYMIREFSRHLSRIRASQNGQPIALQQLSKNRWQAAPTTGPLDIHYEVYAYDLSVRTAYLDEQRGFFNGSSVFLAVAGQEQQPCIVHLARPGHPAGADWRVATTLQPLQTPAWSFGSYTASNYDELIDKPIEMGHFEPHTFSVAGTPHTLVLTGSFETDWKRLKQDIQKICAAQIELFGAPAPFDRYLFLTHVTQDGYGGLEHRDSTALLTSRRSVLPGKPDQQEDYADFLGLVSHEYFHAWNVKRIKPAAFVPYDLERENHTRLLWAFEGITSYYDDLMLLRARRIKPETYLNRLAKTITQVARTPGSSVQTLEQSSLEAWTKYYRPDENSPNIVASYYAKGSLVALALDLTIRRATQEQRSLDDVMRALWQRHGQTGIGVAEHGWEQLAAEVSGLELSAFFDQALRSTEPLALAPLLAEYGITLRWRTAQDTSDRGGKPQALPATQPIATFGARGQADPLGCKLATVFRDGAAEQAGLAGGDVIVAVNHLKINGGDLDRAVRHLKPGDQVTVHAFRREQLKVLEVRLQARPEDTADLLLSSKADPKLKERQRAWWFG